MTTASIDNDTYESNLRPLQQPRQHQLGRPRPPLRHQQRHINNHNKRNNNTSTTTTKTTTLNNCNDDTRQPQRRHIDNGSTSTTAPSTHRLPRRRPRQQHVNNYNEDWDDDTSTAAATTTHQQPQRRHTNNHNINTSASRTFTTTTHQQPQDSRRRRINSRNIDDNHDASTPTQADDPTIITTRSQLLFVAKRMRAIDGPTWVLPMHTPTLHMGFYECLVNHLRHYVRRRPVATLSSPSPFPLVAPRRRHLVIAVAIAPSLHLVVVTTGPGIVVAFNVVAPSPLLSWSPHLS
ncbi:hypothetical protein EDB85DRAFT_2155500 [Lactarius pseudohatsudake]|nr:hypothetical protein EDB85DRAFT_2155500 [Lactarius pseudohatsudake]